MQATTSLIRKTIAIVVIAVLAMAGLSAQNARQAFSKKFRQALE